MREILFKAKRIDNGKWVEGYYQKRKDCYECDEHLIFSCKSYRVWEYAEIDPETLCQYTGVTDKNGTKIWEIDIVEIPSEDDYFRVEWEEDRACFLMNNDSFSVTFDNYWSYETEVIENVFDSAEFVANMRGEKND